MRITKAFVRARFKRVAEIFGWNTEAYREGKVQVGAVVLDHAACYGGYRLDYIANEGGGEGWLFGRMERRSGPEMVAYLTGLEDGAELARKAERESTLSLLKMIEATADIQNVVIAGKLAAQIARLEGRANG